MRLRKSFQFSLYACVFQLKDRMVFYSGYTDSMVFHSAPVLCLREGHFSNRSPGQEKPVVAFFPPRGYLGGGTSYQTFSQPHQFCGRSYGRQQMY